MSRMGPCTRIAFSAIGSPASGIRISPNKVARMIAGLKELYTFLDEYGYMDEEEIKAFRRMVRNNRQEWKEVASGRDSA